MGQLLLTAAGQAGASFLQAGVSTFVGDLFAPDREGPRLEGLNVQTSTEGAFVPIVYGRMRLSGQVIWMGPVTESAMTSS